MLAMPHATLEVSGKPAVARRVARVVAAQEVSTVVVGLPLKLDGQEGEAARRARRFAESLGALPELGGVEIVMWDERLTTAAAERSLRTGAVRGARQRQVVDQVAAALLLQSYLDAQRSGGGRDGDPDA